MENVITQHITRTPGVCGGRPCIAGHRVRVQDIMVWYELHGCSVDQIVEMFPGISKADVHAALVYYFDNTDEIRGDCRKDEEWARWADANLSSHVPPELKENLGG
jgi:uncharacterized protein (DUF433 family)